jgi:hypothetical protein
MKTAPRRVQDGLESVQDELRGDGWLSVDEKMGEETR